MNNSLIWKREVLSNGLTILQYPNKSAMTAQVSVAVKYGSNDDGDGKVGAAHLLEHMLVGGSQKRIKLHHQIEKIGGCSGFETSNDCTFAWVSVFSGKIVEASQILIELIFSQDFESDKLKIERKVVLNEIADISDDPKEIADQALLKSLFPAHPIRNLIAGTKTQVKMLRLLDLEESHRNQYVPKNMVLILTGNYTDANGIIDLFNNKENHGLINRRLGVETAPPKKITRLRKSGINQAYLNFGLRTPPANHDDTAVFSLINSILGLGESSRLFIELREKRALTYDFHSSNNTGLDYGYFSIACSVKVNLWRQTLEIIKAQLNKLTIERLSNEELEKSKNLILGGIARGIDDPHELPRLIADTELMFSNEKELSAYLERIRSLTSIDIMNVAKKYFREENYSTAILAPKLKD
jgi:predicted Zn-dependent peptidase